MDKSGFIEMNRKRILKRQSKETDKCRDGRIGIETVLYSFRVFIVMYNNSALLVYITELKSTYNSIYKTV